MKRAKLILKDGSAWTGIGFGHEGTAVGEIAFTTLMGGTTEQMTDPRCHGQLLTHTFTMIGNYGVPEGLGRAWPAGVIAREICDNPSNYQCAGALAEYLHTQRIPGVSGVDTRALMRRMRNTGPQLGVIAPMELDDSEALALIEEYAPPAPPVPEAFTLPAKKDGEFEKFHVTVLDFGAGAAIAHSINAFGCRVSCVPFDTPAEKLLEVNPDAIVLSDGYGDPAFFTQSRGAVKAALQANKPMLANGTGFLMLTETLGGSLSRMKHPHRGGNQPVREARTGKLLITAQYHGYEVGTPPDGAAVTYANLHGDSIEGYSIPSKNISGVQFDLTPQTGPHDPSTILKDFIYTMAEVAR